MARNADLSGKICPLGQYWHDCYGLTDSALIGFEPDPWEEIHAQYYC